MIEVDISPEMVVEAQTRATKLGVLRNSITKGRGNVAGYLGEIVAHSVLGGDPIDSRNYDLVLPDGERVDVKTKRTKSKPRAHYTASVAQYNTTQDCDSYLFVRVTHDYSKAWIVGKIAKKDFYSEAELVKKGYKDPDNGWQCTDDCYSLPIYKLDEVTA